MNAPAMAANPARKAAQEFHFDCFERNSISSSGSATLNWGVPLRSLTVAPHNIFELIAMAIFNLQLPARAFMFEADL